MSENEVPKKRRLWQLHLSTAILLMFAAAGLLGVSMMDKVGPKPPGFDLDRDELNGTFTHQHGWPYVARETIYLHKDPRPKYATGPGDWPRIQGEEISTWKPTALWLDALIALGLLSGIGVMAESLLRRREGRKP